MSLVITNPDRRWPGAVVPYVIDDDDFPAGSPARQVVEDAIAYWNTNTVMTLQPRSAESDFVVFREQEANCNSKVGRQGNEQAIICDLGGSRQSKIPDQTSKASPALATYGANLHMVHLGKSTNTIWHSWYDGDDWADNVKVNNPDGSPQLSKAAPALAEFNGALHMVHLGDSSNTIWHSWFDGTQWSENVPVEGPNGKIQRSQASPALAVVSGVLHMLYRGNDSSILWHSWFEGSIWSNSTDHAEQTSQAGPALAALDDRLHLVHLGESSKQLWHSLFFAGSWTPDYALPGQQSQATPAIAAFQDRIHIVHVGATSTNLWHSMFDRGEAAGYGVGSVIHEIGHAIGLSHEQQREDRGHFVVIDFDEVIEEKKPNFQQKIKNHDESGVYDYASRMHYGPKAANADGGVTIRQGHATAAHAGTYADIGTASELSDQDLMAVYALYPPWTDNVTIGHSTRMMPAIATFGSKLHMVYLGESDNKLWHTTYDGGKWAGPVEIVGQTSKAAPALAVYDGLLHMVHLGKSSNDLWHSFYNGSNWSKNEKIPDQKSKTTPALAEFAGRLHMVHLGDSSNDIWHSSYDWRDGYGATSWLPNARAFPNQKSKATPALAVWRNELHMVHLGDSSNTLWHSAFDGGRWSYNIPIYHQKSQAAVALTVYRSDLHMVHLGNKSNLLWHSINDEVWRPNVPIEDQLSKAAPAMAVYQDRVHTVHIGDTTNQVWHTQHYRP